MKQDKALLEVQLSRPICKSECRPTHPWDRSISLTLKCFSITQLNFPITIATQFTTPSMEVGDSSNISTNNSILPKNGLELWTISKNKTLPSLAKPMKPAPTTVVAMEFAHMDNVPAMQIMEEATAPLALLLIMLTVGTFAHSTKELVDSAQWVAIIVTSAALASQATLELIAPFQSAQVTATTQEHALLPAPALASGGRWEPIAN